jgi:hypothetical protein
MEGKVIGQRRTPYSYDPNDVQDHSHPESPRPCPFQD